MSDQNNDKKPADIRAVGSMKTGDQDGEKIFINLWAKEGKEGQFGGYYNGERVIAFYNPESNKDGKEFSANLRIRKVVGEGDNVEYQDVETLYINHGERGSWLARNVSENQKLSFTVLEGHDHLNMKAAASRHNDAPSAGM